MREPVVVECRARSNGGGSSASEVKRVRVFLRDFGLAASTDERVESAERTGCGALRDEERVLVQAVVVAVTDLAALAGGLARI